MTKFFLKTSTLFFFVILMAQGIYAQKAKLSYDKKTDIISADNVPFAKMVRTPGDLIGLNKNYSIQNLEGEELVFLKYTLREHWDREEQKNVSTIWYEITFTQSGARASIEKGLGMQKSGAMKLAFQNDLIKDGKIDPEAEARFIHLFHGSYPTSAPYESHAKVVLNGNEILQEGNLIGKFLVKTITSPEMIEMMVLSVYSADGVKIAEAEAPTTNAMEWAVVTLVDEKTYGFLYNAPNEKENLFDWLIDNNYL